MSGNWLDLSSSSNRFQQAYVQGFVDVSGGNVLLRAGPTNNNHLILQGGDISLNGRLNVATGTSASVYNNFYGKVPPTTSATSTYAFPTVSPNTTNATSSTWMNSGITWIASSNTANALVYAYSAFNNQTTDTGSTSGWATGNYSSAGAYSGSTTTSVNKNSTITSVSGDWLQIQSNMPLMMSSYTLTTGGYSGFSVMGRVPGAYTIAGSNDGNTWTALQDVSFTSLPSGFNLTTATSSPTTMQTTSSFLVSAATGNQNNANITTYTTQSNSYYYIRIIVIRTLNGSFSIPNSGQMQFSWTPVFTFFSTAATQTGPSRALIYMDPSNINQVDVSGSLGLINSSPTSITVIPNTGQYIASTTTNGYLNNWNNNNVSWYSSASSVYSATVWPWNAFMPASSSTNSFGWAPGNGSLTGYYNASTGAYQTASTSTTVSGSSKSGEWIQLQSSIPLILTSYYLQPSIFNGSNYIARMPATYTIAGSNDGTTWYGIQDASFTSTPVPNSTTNIVNTVTYTIPTSTTAAIQTNNSIKGYGTSSSASYTYFRFITGSMMSTRFGATASDTALNVNWFPNFSPASSSVSLALDNITPNQLNIGGSLSTCGETQYSYSSVPTFSSNSIGYSVTNTSSNSINFSNATPGMFCIINGLPIGVYLIAYQFSTNSGNASGHQIYIVNNASSSTAIASPVNISPLMFGQPQASTIAGSFTYRSTNPNNSYGIWAQTLAGTTSAYVCQLQLTRIA